MTPLEAYTCNKCKPNTKKIYVELGQDMPPDLHESPNNANNQCEQLCQSTMLPSTHTMAEPARSRPPVLAPSPVVAEVRLKDSTISHCHKKTHNQAFWTPAQTLFPPQGLRLRRRVATSRREVATDVLIAALGGGGWIQKLCWQACLLFFCCF